MARLLLTRAGFVVATAETTRHLEALVVSCRINVVIVDATNSVTGAARTIAALGALASPVKVVAVADDPEQSQLENLRLLPKWTDWDEIVNQVEVAYGEAA